MDTMLSSALLEKIKKGEKVKCPNCGIGIIVPTFPNHVVKRDYHCEKCGYREHYDVQVIIE